MVVMGRLVFPAGIVNNLMLEPNPARLDAIGELEIVEHPGCLGRGQLLGLPALE